MMSYADKNRANLERVAKQRQQRSDQFAQQRQKAQQQAQDKLNQQQQKREMDDRVKDEVSKRLKEKGLGEEISFFQFMEAKALDPSLAGGASIRQTGEGGRKYPKLADRGARIEKDRRAPEGSTKRMKAAGGGKMVPAKRYKDRKDIGQTRARSSIEQQPTKERGSAALSAKEQQRKAYLERKAREKSGSSAPKKKEAEKAATQLLKKKTTKTVHPDYKPAKASGYTRQERDKIKGKGERMLRGIFKDQETEKYRKATGTNPDAKGRTKILGRVNARMSK